MLGWIHIPTRAVLLLYMCVTRVGRCEQMIASLCPTDAHKLTLPHGLKCLQGGAVVLVLVCLAACGSANMFLMKAL